MDCKGWRRACQNSASFCLIHILLSHYRTQKTEIKDQTRLDLLEIVASGNLEESRKKDLAELRKRKLIVQRFPPQLHLISQPLTSHRKGQYFTVHKGPKFSTSTAKPETDLTVEMLARLGIPRRMDTLSTPPFLVVHGRRPSSKSIISRLKVHPRLAGLFIHF